MKLKRFLPALAVIASISPANAMAVVYDSSASMDMDNSNANATTYVTNSTEIHYRNKNLANYQDPYLTNPQAYKSNQYGEAAPSPKQNVFYNGYAPVYNAQEAAVIENELDEPASGPNTDLYIER